MTSREIFDVEITALENKMGSKTRLRTYQVLTEVVRWLHHCGHGNITLSAVNSLLAEKLKTETIVSINNKESSDHYRE